MRRKVTIVLAITFMVAVIVTISSYLYVSQFLRQSINNTYDSSYRLTQQLAYFAENDLPDLSSTRIDTDDPAAVRRALAEYLPMDTNLLNNLESDTSGWPYIYDASVVDANGQANSAASGLSKRHHGSLPRTTSFGVPTHRGLRRELPAAAQRRTFWHDPHRRLHGPAEGRTRAPPDACPLFLDCGDFRLAVAGGDDLECGAGPVAGDQPQPRQRQPGNQ